MTLPLVILLAIVTLTVLAFALEWAPIDVVALGCLAALLLFDLVSADEAISGFSNPAVITVMMMFVLSSSLMHSGIVTRIGHWITEVTGTSRWGASLLLLVTTGVLSAFINNTAAVSVFIPVAIHLAKHFRFSPSKILMPLSWVAIFGGTCTLIGTSTNLLVSALAPEHGIEPFRVFEFMRLGMVFLLVGLAYTIVFPLRFLPSRVITSSLTRKYHLSGFLTELKVPADSKIVGRNVLEENLSERFQMTVLEILRGERKIAYDIRSVRLEEGDILLVRGAMENILGFKQAYNLLLLTDIKLDDSDLNDESTILAEIQLSPTSGLVGSTLKEINFRKRYGAFVIALSRTGDLLQNKIAWIPLKGWDTLLVFGPRQRVEQLSEEDDFIPLGERDLSLRLHPRWWLSSLVIPLVVLVAAVGLMPIVKAAILGVVLLLVARVLTVQQLYRSIDWQVIFLLAAILPLGAAMERTGMAALIGDGLGRVGEQAGPTALVSVIYLATGLLTSIFSNGATAVLMVPIAASAGASLGIDPKPLLMAVTYAASASFMTPVGYQTNTMVYGPGNYRFMDYIRFGAPLNLVFWVLATFLIPVFWPF